MSLPAARRRREPHGGVEHRVHEVDQRGLIARQHPVCQDVSHLDDRPAEVHARGHGQALAGLLVGAGYPVGPRMSSTHCDAPRGAPSESVELTVDDFRGRRGVQSARRAGRAGRVSQG